MKKMQDRAKAHDFFADLVPGGDSNKSYGDLETASLIFVEGMPEISGDTDFDKIGYNFTEPGEWIQKIKPKIRFTGPLLAESPEKLPSQEELKIRYTGHQDQPLVYVTIGGGTNLIGEKFLSLVLEAFRLLPEVKGVVSTGLAISEEQIAGALPGGDYPPDNVIIRQFVPGTELIKASDAVVFHGGSSTLMTCIACGRPAVVVPSMAEQEDNGMVLSHYKAGIVLDKQSLTPEILTIAIRRILENASFRHQAEELKKLSEKYGGADGAAIMMEQLLEERSLVHAGTDSGSR